VDVEVVTDDVPPGIECAGAQQPAEKACKILFSPPVADHAFDFAGGNIEGRNQGLRAMAAVLELAPLDFARAIGNPGAMRSSAWMPVISSMAMVRRASSGVAAAL
jgi:hypothetical protein